MARWIVRGSKVRKIASRTTSVAAATLIQHAQPALPEVFVLGVPSTVLRRVLEQIDCTELSVSVTGFDIE